jgi:hypothetical protein
LGRRPESGMELLSQLWLPILVSAAAVWVASAIVWMALPHHKKDWSPMPDEAAFYQAFDSLKFPPGNYGFPDMKDKARCKDPEVKRRWEAGEMGLLSIWGKVSMGRNMVVTFVVYLVISLFVGYIAQLALANKPGAGFKDVFQVAGAAGVLGYAFGHIPGSVWFAAYPRAIAMCVIDGIAYGLITGLVFAAMWPGA